jgi:hypothetical protein
MIIQILTSFLGEKNKSSLSGSGTGNSNTSPNYSGPTKGCDEILEESYG